MVRWVSFSLLLSLLCFLNQIEKNRIKRKIEEEIFFFFPHKKFFFQKNEIEPIGRTRWEKWNPSRNLWIWRFLLSERRRKLEDLSNELIEEIFDFLDFLSIFAIFSELNFRFFCLVKNFPRKIVLTLTERTTFERRTSKFIEKKLRSTDEQTESANRRTRSALSIFNDGIRSDRSRRAATVSLTFSHNFFFFFPMENLKNLKSIRLERISSKNLLEFERILPSFDQLVSLSIETFDFLREQNSTFEKIFSVETLKFFRFEFPSGARRTPLRRPKGKTSNIESFFLVSNIFFDQFVGLVSFLPRLKHFRCEKLIVSIDDSDSDLPELNFIQTLRFKFQFFDVQFLKRFLNNFSATLTDFKIEIDRTTQFFDANLWRNLIEDLPRLTKFDFQFQTEIARIEDVDSTKIESFRTEFWTKRNFFFDFQIFTESENLFFRFFSRRKNG